MAYLCLSLLETVTSAFLYQNPLERIVSASLYLNQLVSVMEIMSLKKMKMDQIATIMDKRVLICVLLFRSQIILTQASLICQS